MDIKLPIETDDYQESVDTVAFDFAPSRRTFVQVLGAGLLIAVSAPGAEAQSRRGGRGGRGGFGGGGARNVAARVHIGKDGAVTVLTGKIECGQGARAELTLCAAEELRLTPAEVNLIMGDTDLVPNDGITAGSRTTPSTVPAVRQGCAAARELLRQLAARTWKVEASTVKLSDGKASNGGNALTYAHLAAEDDAGNAFEGSIPRDVTVTPVAEWKVLGTTLRRPNGRDIVTGTHPYPSDTVRPGMLYGRILRPPSYGARLTSLDASAAKAMKGVVVVQDGSFVGVAAPTAYEAEEAVSALADGAKWSTEPHPSSKDIYDYLRQHARGGVPRNPFAADVASAARSLQKAYDVAYVQHVPMEPRAAVAEWSDDGKVTVWMGTQNPFGCRGEIARALRIGDDRVRVIVPDFGGGFGGKHSAEHGVEAARLAQAAKHPVWIRWTREEEFTWAYFRPAAVIDAQASLDASGKLTSWHFVNINSGGSAVQSPYRIARSRSQFVGSDSPLRIGSYRGLAATANNFAREAFMDELAELAGQDALAFRLNHLDPGRLRDVLEAAAKHFDWSNRIRQKSPNRGVGLACGTEKGSYVAACAEVAIDPKTHAISVVHVCEVFECGKILNPDNLLAQVQGAIVMGLGPALREETKFEKGKITNGTFFDYLVPRFADLPELDIHLLDRPDLPSVGAGETPLIAIAPAIANAVFHATGQRMHEMPMRVKEA